MLNANGYVLLTYHPQPRLHRYLTNAPRGIDVDHINGDKLDNRKANLRLCSRTTNLRNRSHPYRNAPYIGVSLHKPTGKWQPHIGFHGLTIRLPLCATAEEANLARLTKEKELWGVQPRRRQSFIAAGMAVD